MKGVILAGGKGTRLSPLTELTNKHLLPVGKEPMIYNPIRQLLSADIKEIMIVTAKEYIDDFFKLLQNGNDLGCNFTYMVQDEPRGIADAVLLSEGFARNDYLAVILGDNIAVNSIRPYAQKFIEQGGGAKVLLKKVNNPSRYGVAALDKQNIIMIEEKPPHLCSGYAVTGIYFYDSNVFEIIRGTKPSGRGEYEITPVNNEYLARGQLTYDVLDGDWIDAGTYESYLEANALLFNINNEIRR